MARKNKGYSERRKPYDVYKAYIEKFEESGRYLEKALSEEEFEAEYSKQQKKNSIARKRGHKERIVNNIARSLAYDTLVISKAELKEIESRGLDATDDDKKYKKEDLEEWMNKMTWEDAKGEVHVATSKRQAIYMNLRMLRIEEGSMGFIYFIGEEKAIY